MKKKYISPMLLSSETPGSGGTVIPFSQSGSGAGGDLGGDGGNDDSGEEGDWGGFD